MSDKDDQKVSVKEAAKEVEIASRRIGLLHLSFAKTLVDEFGEEKGKELVIKAIERYGKMIGEKAKTRVKEQGLDVQPENFSAGGARDLPKYGMHEKREVTEEEGEKRIFAYGCALAKVWREYNEEELGGLYCYVDPVKYMYYNPEFKLVHKQAMPYTGQNICEFAVEKTSKEEQDSVLRGKADWEKIDKDLKKD